MLSLAMRRLAFCLLAACGGAAASAPPVSNAGGAAPKVDALYAPLFQRGRTWTYAVSDGKQQGTMTCAVARVETEGVKVSSHIDCSGFLDENLVTNPLAGDWVSDGGGLARADGVRVLAARPVARHDAHYDRSAPEGANGDPVGETIVEKDGNDWCWKDSSNEGDVTWRTLCFGETGVESGEAGWQGDRATSVKLTLLH